MGLCFVGLVPAVVLAGVSLYVDCAVYTLYSGSLLRWQLERQGGREGGKEGRKEGRREGGTHYSLVPSLLGFRCSLVGSGGEVITAALL